MIYPTQLAPDFEAEAYHNGQKTTIRLSDFQNQWVLLFYEETTGLGVPAYWKPGMTGILRDLNLLGKSKPHLNIIIH